MSRYNKLKAKALASFSEAHGEWLKPSEFARGIRFVPQRSAWTYLKKLWKFGLLDRHSSGKGTLKYRISERGRLRLRWLRSKGH